VRSHECERGTQKCVRHMLFLIAVQAAAFQQEVAHIFTTQDGLPSNDVITVAVVNGQVFAKTTAGIVKFSQGKWVSGATDFPAASANAKNYSPAEGSPYDKITSVVAGEAGVTWFATPRGAIRFDGKSWEYRQGRRWLPDDEVRAIAVEANGNAWFATKKGVGCRMTRFGPLPWKPMAMPGSQPRKALG